MNDLVFHKNCYFLSEDAMKDYFEKCLYMEDDCKKRCWDIFILINRKGYWDYKIFFPHGFKDIQECLIISDRYLEKCPNDKLQELLLGKNVIIYDDSLSKGSNLFFYYLLCKKYGAEKIIPVVYALNSEFPSEQSRILLKREAQRIYNDKTDAYIENCIQNFESTLSYKLILGIQDIDRMSIWQTNLFQKNVSPLVMDLPIINHTTENHDTKIILSETQFQQLILAKNTDWQFIENELTGYGCPIKASYFHFSNWLFESTIGGQIYDLVVKCKYEKCNGIVAVVFTPFPIMGSMTFEDVFTYFSQIYKDTLYGKELLKYFPDEKYSSDRMEKDHNLCRAMFRAIIYYLASYIGRKFKYHVKQILGVSLEYDRQIMKDNFDSIFIETWEALEQSFDEQSFHDLMKKQPTSVRVYSIGKKIYLGKEKKKATQERINNYIRFRIIQKKQDIEASLRNRIYTIETIEDECADRFLFEDEANKRKFLTSAILLLLETNSFSNFIYISSGEHIIFRGFRYGENSDILLHENLWYFYAYLHAYYIESTSSECVEQYKEFMSWLENQLIKKRYMGVWISKDGFDFLKMYFEKLNEQNKLIQDIKRRRYLLNCFDYGKENSIRAEKIQEAADIVKQWRKV